MGDLEGGPQPSGLRRDQAAAYALSFTKSRSIDNVRWNKAEERTTELIRKIRGTRSSEERRKDVADYVENLIRKCFDCQVCRFGSVPLKTYLPDGDIDLTIVSRDLRLKDTWANAVRSALEREESSPDAKFGVKEIQYINAEVKVIKCHVENIVVDISFNQLGGLCTLCFLEEVDRVIGKDHFFKQSIILVKAWCYYEGTILGAHHGLISTYALETLVLYIFHVFHSSLRGPLEVLLRFLEFFSKFDWQNYAVSVSGPVPLSSLPEIIGNDRRHDVHPYAVEAPRKDGGELLLSKEFMDLCFQDYAVFLTGPDSQGRAFTAKHLNIVDPLRADNNLGRSVNKSNFTRITMAFGHSADKLLNMLLDSTKDIDDYFEDKEVGFFKRTKDRLDKFVDKRPDASDGIVESVSPLSTGSDASFIERASVESVDTGLSGSGRGNQHTLSASQSTNLPVYNMGNGSFANGEPVEKPTGPHMKTSMNSLGENNEHVLKVHWQSFDRQESDSNATQSSEQRDPESVIEDYTLRRAASSRSNSTQTNFDSSGVLEGSNESRLCEPSQGSSNLAIEVLPEGSRSVRKGSSSHGMAKGGSHQNGLVGDQPSYVDTNGGLDGQGFVQHRGQDAVSIGPQPVSVMPPGQIPGTYSHPGQGPMHLPKSMTVSSSKGHVSTTLAGSAPPLGLDSVRPSFVSEPPLALAPRAGPFVMQIPRGPPAPPLPPGYFNGPPWAHHLSPLGETPNGVGRLSSYSGQQGEDKGFQQQQVWPQMDQKQVHDQQPKYCYMWPASTISAAVPPLPQFLNSENALGISSAPAHVTSGPFPIPTSFSLPGTPASRSATGKTRITHNGGSINLESLAANTAGGDDILEDVQVDENGSLWGEDVDMGSSTTTRGKLSSQPGSDTGGRGIKNSKNVREKRTSNKSKSTSSEDHVDSGGEGMPSASAESSNHWPPQGIADDPHPQVQGYPQLVPTSRPVLGPTVYPHMLASSLPPQGNGIVVSESSYPRTTVGLTSISPHGSSNSSRPPGIDLVNGSSGLSTSQRQRPMERTPIPSSVYYQPPNCYSYPMFSPAYPFLPLFGIGYSGLHSSNSLDNYNDAALVQADDCHQRSTQQGRPGVGERLRAAGVPTSAISKSETTAADMRASDAVDANDISGDLLSSDLSGLRENLRFARWCQNPHLTVPVYGQPPFVNPSAKYFPEYRQWEGPGRPLASTMNTPANGMSHGRGLAQGHAPLNTSACMVANFARTFPGPINYGGDEPPKSYAGTGTYLPNPRPPYTRDRQSSGNGRNQHGGYGHERGERVDRDGNQVHGARFRGSGRGQSKYEPRSQNVNVGVERNLDVKGGERGRDFHRQHDGFRRNAIQFAPGPSFTSSSLGVSPVTVVSPISAEIPVEKYSGPILTDKPSATGTVVGTVPLVRVYPIEKTMDIVTEPLEFGSLGPVHVKASQEGSEVDSGSGQVSSVQTPEQVNAHSPPQFAGLSLASSDRSTQGAASSKHRVMQREYQLKEEDFPPLSFRGQHGSTSSSLNSGSSANSQSSPYPAYVVMPSW